MDLYLYERWVNVAAMTREGNTMSISRSLNFLMISAAFVFVGAMVAGVLP